MRFGFISASHSACAWSRRCWPRDIVVGYETVRQWAMKFGQAFANQIRRRLPRTGDK
jgi:transposase-like protein